MDDWLVDGQVQAVCFHMKTTKALICEAFLISSYNTQTAVSASRGLSTRHPLRDSTVGHKFYHILTKHHNMTPQEAPSKQQILKQKMKCMFIVEHVRRPSEKCK